jgi:glycerol-3-phosphate acyltransferase PlsY
MILPNYLCCIIGYFLGSIPFGAGGSASGQKDILQYGSGKLGYQCIADSG